MTDPIANKRWLRNVRAWVPPSILAIAIATAILRGPASVLFMYSDESAANAPLKARINYIQMTGEVKIANEEIKFIKIRIDDYEAFVLPIFANSREQRPSHDPKFQLPVLRHAIKTKQDQLDAITAVLNEQANENEPHVPDNEVRSLVIEIGSWARRGAEKLRVSQHTIEDALVNSAARNVSVEEYLAAEVENVVIEVGAKASPYARPKVLPPRIQNPRPEQANIIPVSHTPPPAAPKTTTREHESRRQPPPPSTHRIYNPKYRSSGHSRPYTSGSAAAWNAALRNATPGGRAPWHYR